jgi:hypothetical protein
MPKAPQIMETVTSRRRSQRLFLEVPVLVEGKLANGAAFREEAYTSVLNAHGALVQMSVQLEQGQIVGVQNIRTRAKCDCHVKLITPAGAGKFNTAMEFAQPNPDFWCISFPPEDWALQST